MGAVKDLVGAPTPRIAREFVRDDGSFAKLLIIGHGRHGKDATAEAFQRVCGMRFVSSSEFCAQKVVYPLMADLYPDWRACYEDRARHRALWFHAIKAYNLRPGPTLAQQILTDHDIYVGMRSREEFERTRDSFDVVLWVDALQRLPPEPMGSMELNPCDADLIIDNNGTLQDLETRVRELVLEAKDG